MLGQTPDVESILSYIDYRHWRSNLFLNISILILGALLAKVAGNFISGKPGFAGIRFHGPCSFMCFKMTFQHKDPELKYPAKYHVQRYLENKAGICIPESGLRYGINHMYGTDAETWIPESGLQYAIDQIYECCEHQHHHPQIVHGLSTPPDSPPKTRTNPTILITDVSTPELMV